MVMTKASGALTSLLLVVLSACGEAPRDIFGRSYDECILMNASSEGDAASRQTATEVCARHFERAPTPDEARLVSGQVTPLVTMGYSDVVLVMAQNDSSSLLVTEVAVDVDFHPEPADSSGIFADSGRTIHWTFAAHLEPHAQQDFRGSFTEGHAPMRWANLNSRPYATRVVELGTPPERPFDLNRILSGDRN